MTSENVMPEERRLICEMTWTLRYAERGYYSPLSTLADLAETEMFPDHFTLSGQVMDLLCEDEFYPAMNQYLKTLDPRFPAWLRRWADLCDPAQFKRLIEPHATGGTDLSGKEKPADANQQA